MSFGRHAITWALVWVVLGVMVGCGPGDRTAKPPANPLVATGAFEVADEPLAQAGDERLMTLAIEGMHCQGCASGIAEKLAGMPGVKKARVSFSRKTAWLLADRDQGPDAASVVAALTDMGYRARPADSGPAQATGPAAQ